MSQNLEYQARFKAETAELKAAQNEIKNTGKAFTSVAQAGGGMTMVMTGMTGALKGNVGSLLQVAMGAGMVWKAFANLNPVIRILTLVLGAASIAASLFNKHQEETAKKTEESKRALEQLGLAVSDLERHQRQVKASADAYDIIEKKAAAAANAIRDMTAAQIAYNQAVGNANLANIDLREATELAGAKTDEERREIRGRYAEERAGSRRDTANADFDLKKKAHLEERANIVNDANRQEENERARLTGNVNDAKSSLSHIIDKIARDQVDAMEVSSPYASERQKQSEARRAKYLEMEEMKSAFATNPSAAAEKYRTMLPEDKAGDIGGLLKALDGHQAALKGFEESAPDRAEDTSKKLAEHAVRGAIIGQEFKGAVDSADAELTRTKTGLTAEEQSEKDRQEKEAELRREQEAKARDRVAAAAASDRFDRMSDPQKAKHLAGEVQDIQSALRLNQKAIASEEDPEKRTSLVVRQGQLAEELAAKRKEGRSVLGRIEKQQSAEAKVQSSRDEQVSAHKNTIEDIRARRSETAMDTQSVFKHMYDVKAGQSPDEQVARNTADIKEHMAAIANLLQESTS